MDAQFRQLTGRATAAQFAALWSAYAASRRANPTHAAPPLPRAA